MKRMLVLLVLMKTTSLMGFSQQSHVICKDTMYFIRNKFVYCDSVQPSSCSYKKGKFYEVRKYNKAGEEILRNCKNNFSSPKYIIFVTKNGKRIEEGYYSGIWEFTFIKGIYQAYYKNGKLKCKGEYINSFKTGKWLFYDEQGKLIKEEEHIPPLKQISD